MKREIKFRAIDQYMDDFIYFKAFLYDAPRKQHRAILGIETYSMDTHDIKGETISQYTGLKDKHGKEIYEGDIVMFDLIGLDDQHPPEKGLKGQVKCQNIGCLTFDGWNYEFCTNIEVVGNIYENPNYNGIVFDT